jgi:DNA-binding response OmpR family regulator
MTSKILIGDDNQQMLRSLSRALRFKGLETDLASTSQEVIEKARQGNYSAIITDLAYTEGGREGYEVLKQIKQVSAIKILYTAESGFEHVPEGFMNGADYVVLRKDSSQLMEILQKENILEGRK